MGLFKGHCFYINKIDVLCQNRECNGCKQIFKKSCNLTSHLMEDRCTGGKTKLICLGRKFKRILNSLEKVFYGGETGFSYSACQWIEHMSEETGRHIHHKMCGHGGERQVTVWYLNSKGEKACTTYPVDGYEPETRTVYQFHGCKWHGHPCIKDRTKKQRKRYRDTLAIDRLIENNGVDTVTHKNSKFNLVKMWECEKPYKKSVKFEKVFRQYPHFIVHDWEAIQKPLNEQPTDYLTYITEHVPVSVAIYDTLSGETVYLVEKDPEKLVEKFMDVLSKKLDAIVKDVEAKYPYPSDFVMLRKKVKENWKEWVNQVPVVGFNSRKYDMNMIKEYFVKRVSFDEDVFAAKKDNGYMFITTSRFKFLDVKNYIGPGLSYNAWCRSMGCKLHKFVFPYKWLDSYEKLNLPCHNIVFQDFFSTLDGRCIVQCTKNALLKH